MAGGRRKGCLTCRKRKIKCDERRPRCLHCETSSRECVGWASEIEFVAQKQESIPISTGRPSHLSYRLKGFRFKDPACTFEKRKRCSNQATGVVIPDTSSASLKDTEDARTCSSSSGASCPTSLISLAFPGSEATRLAGKLVRYLNGTSGTSFSILYCGEYFQELPLHTGHNECLDAALNCVLAARQCTPTPTNSHMRLQKYGQALKLLQMQLDNGETRLQPESLCSALILNSAAVVDEDLHSHHHYLSHADGATAILRAFGPERINSRFELQMFYAHLPTLVFKSLLLTTKCFIDTPDWRTLEQKIPDSWSVDRFEAGILHTYARLPAFIHSLRTPRATSGSEFGEDSLLSALSLKEDLFSLNDRVNDFLKDTDMVLECPPLWTSSERGPSTYHLFKDIRLAEALSIFWRALIVVTNGLRQLRMATPADEEIAMGAALRLCMSAEHVQTWKPLGSLFACLNLRVARLACSQALSRWLDQELWTIEQNLGPAIRKVTRLYNDLAFLRSVMKY